MIYIIKCYIYACIHITCIRVYNCIFHSVYIKLILTVNGLLSAAAEFILKRLLKTSHPAYFRIRIPRKFECLNEEVAERLMMGERHVRDGRHQALHQHQQLHLHLHGLLITWRQVLQITCDNLVLVGLNNGGNSCINKCTVHVRLS